MPKRKAGVNNIIYELDNDDIEISSDEEVREPKMQRSVEKPAVMNISQDLISDSSCVEITESLLTDEDVVELLPQSDSQNGGKTSDVEILSDTENEPVNAVIHTKQIVETDKVSTSECPKTTILNEDIEVDSPGSCDLGVVGCENRTPLVTVHFKDQKLARNYKKHIKAFMLNLIKLHNEDSLTGSETDTDLELDVWPEDLEDDVECDKEEVEDNLFFVDTLPCSNDSAEVPTYRQNCTLISNAPVKESSPPPVLRRGPSCFNCDGAHQLRDCSLPRDNSRIAEKRKNMGVRVGRYHVEDEQKYGHLVPGRISGQLRHALALKRHELPLHIYRMRILGYPPGWLEEARISHSGITLFDSTGNAINDSEEEGEVCDPGSKDKFDIKKILDFPGFNVPASSRYKEEAHLFGLPPMSEQDSKIVMLQMLAPNAMKAYKRKKLTFFPSAMSANVSQEGQAEMELDSGDEVAEFPSVPPLPDEAPPPPPPPPEIPPPPPESPPSLSKASPPLPNSPPPLPEASPPLPKASPPLTNRSLPETDFSEENKDAESVDDSDIPESIDDLIVIDEEGEHSSGRESPSLDDLETKKLQLLNALKSEVKSIDLEVSAKEEDTVTDDNIENELPTSSSNETIEDKGTEILTAKVEEETQKAEVKRTSEIKIEANEQNSETFKNDSQPTETASNRNNTVELNSNTLAAETPNSPTDTISTTSRTQNNKTTGIVKTTAYGTPVMNIASSFNKLPSEDKFSKNISDVINFENLPNSTGKYKKINTLLKKVKTEVDRIHDS